MEFPSLGQNCSERSCKQFDFLPTKCDSCSKWFCQLHYTGQEHACSAATRVNNGDNKKLDQHKVTKSKCSLKGCAEKNLNPLFMISCDYCSLKFCMGHRLPEDHECTRIAEVMSIRPTVRPRRVFNSFSGYNNNNFRGVQSQPSTSNRGNSSQRGRGRGRKKADTQPKPRAATNSSGTNPRGQNKRGRGRGQYKRGQVFTCRSLI